MSKKNFENKNNQKKKLGSLIALCRGKKSLREVARAINIPPSNLSYIEKGINAPTPQIYEKIIATLSPSNADRRKMDYLYSNIRSLPPPDVCNILVANNGLNDVIRTLGNRTLSKDMLTQISELFTSF